MGMTHLKVSVWRIHVTTVTMETQQARVCSLFIAIGTDVAVNNIKVFTVAMELQQWGTFVLL